MENITHSNNIFGRLDTQVEISYQISSDLKREHQSSPLNIVLILVDDLGWNDLGSIIHPKQILP